MRLVTANDIEPWRRDLGWKRPDYGNIETVIGPDARTLDGLFDEASHWDVNVFSGLKAYPFIECALMRCMRTSTMLGVMSEARNWHGLTGSLRLISGRLQALRYANAISFVLAIGHLGEQWFRMSGYRPERLFRFGYFVPDPLLFGRSPNPAEASLHFNLVFIGQLVKRKGLDVLLRALALTLSSRWRLTVIGDGEEATSLRDTARQFGIGDRVVFVGARENEVAMAMLASADLLVLPSRWDGWGAVVNEALMRGIAVLCSDRCGAADLLDAPWRGCTFRAGDVGALSDALRHWISQGRQSEAARDQRITWSQRIAGPSAATYLAGVIDSVANGQSRPAIPWLRN